MAVHHLRGCRRMKDIDDRGYKKLFSYVEIFHQLIISFVHEPWVKHLNFKKCELMKDSFVSEQYKSSFSDLVYKTKLHGRDFYVVILLEFKSKPDYFVAVQILGYVSDLYRHLLDSVKNIHKLPPVFPILLYNGEEKWNVPVELEALIEGGKMLGKRALHFEYFPIIENSFGQEELLKIGNVVSTLFLAEAHYDFELLERELNKLFRKSRDKKAVSLLLNWLKQLAIHGRIEESDYKKLERTYRDPKEVNMLITAIKREKEQLYHDGLKKGEKKGKKEGKKEGKSERSFEIARQMLSYGEPLEKIEQFTGISSRALRSLRGVAKASDMKNSRKRSVQSNHRMAH